MIIIPCSVDSDKRAYNIKSAAGHYAWSNPGRQVIVLECSEAEHSQLNITSPGVKHIFIGKTRFSLSKMRNKAIEIAKMNGASYLSIVDADAIWDKNGISYCIEAMYKTGTAWGFPFYDKVWMINSYDDLMSKAIHPPMPTGGIPATGLGIILDLQQDIPLYDEAFTVWGAEDKDYFIRMLGKFGPPVRLKLDCYHLSHPQAGGFYNPERMKEERLMWEAKYSKLNPGLFFEAIFL